MSNTIRKTFLLLLLVAGVAGVLWAVMPAATEPSAPETATQRQRPQATVPRLSINEVGNSYILETIVHPSLKDPRSLEQIRDCYLDAGYRAINALEQQLAQEHWPLEKEVGARFLMARLYLYEGDFKKAAVILENVRSLAEQRALAARD